MVHPVRIIRIAGYDVEADTRAMVTPHVMVARYAGRGGGWARFYVGSEGGWLFHRMQRTRGEYSRELTRIAREQERDRDPNVIANPSEKPDSPENRDIQIRPVPHTREKSPKESAGTATAIGESMNNEAASVINSTTVNGTGVALVLSLGDLVVHATNEHSRSWDGATLETFSGPYLTRTTTTPAIVSAVREAWEDWHTYDAPRNPAAV